MSNVDLRPQRHFCTSDCCQPKNGGRLVTAIAAAFAIAVTMFFGLASTVGAQPPAATSQPATADAETLATSASNAQNNSDFAFAEKQWTKLVEQFPQWSRIATAKLNLGICQFQQKKYAAAIDPIKAAVVSGDTTLNIPKALLFLGFSQMKQGDNLAIAKTPADREKSGMYLTTATQTLGKIVKEYPDYENADQALYFQGQAFYKLERYDEAVAAFESLDSFENARFKDVAKYDLASTYQQIGNDVAALTAYQQFRLTLPADDAATLDDVDLQIAKLKMKMSRGATERGDDETARKDLEQARQTLDRIVKDKDSNFWPEASFHQAIIAGDLGDYDRSADLFTQVAAVKDSPFAAQSAVLAGREWIRAENFQRAIDTLAPIAESDSPYGLQAAILLANAFRNAEQPEKAETITAAWMEKSTDDPLHVALLMERAEAAYATPEKKKIAGERFFDIATQFPKDPAAPEALYNATAAFWESYETGSAIKAATLFLENYRQSPFEKDVLEILGDAALVDEDFAKGEQIFRELVEANPKDESRAKWALRIGWSIYLQKKFAKAEEWLNANMDVFQSPKQKSEAWHWLGASQYQQKKYPEAISALNESIDSIQRWDRIDETMLALLRSEIATNNMDEAQLIGAKIASQFPKSPAVAESIFRLGEAHYDQSEFEDALELYDQLLTQYPDSEFVPTAMFGKGWSQLRSGQFEPAEKTFTELIEQFPSIELAEQARMGRSVAHRKLGKSDDAIKDLLTFLATAPDGDRKTSSQFELGLAYVENENWQEAEKQFRALLTLPKDHRLADRTRYELAWVLDAMKKPDASREQFLDLAENFPQSRLASDAHFKIASALYDEQAFEEAAARFEKVLATPELAEELAEKAMYKLGWCLYKQAKFKEASAAFRQQTTNVPNGDLLADGSFMLAQSFFQSGDYEAALSAYSAAMPVLMESKTTPDRLKWLTMLNGAKSANAQKAWQEAIDFATPLTVSATDKLLAEDAWLEIGKARMGLKQIDGAMDAWTRAAVSTEKTGAEARVMKGDLLFQQKRFEEAIDEFKLVFYGYGGSKSSEEIRPLQAYAVYEAARCSYVRISEASDRLKPKLIEDAEKHFRYLIENYSDQTLALEANKQLEILKKIRPGN